MAATNRDNRGCIAVGDKVLVLQHPRKETHYQTYLQRALLLEDYLFGTEEESAEAWSCMVARGLLQ